MDLSAIETNLGHAVDGLKERIAYEVRAASDFGGQMTEETRKRRWLAIRSLQRAEALMREALEIVSC